MKAVITATSVFTEYVVCESVDNAHNSQISSTFQADPAKICSQTEIRLPPKIKTAFWKFPSKIIEFNNFKAKNAQQLKIIKS